MCHGCGYSWWPGDSLDRSANGLEVESYRRTDTAPWGPWRTPCRGAPHSLKIATSCMKTSWHGNIIRITGPLGGESGNIWQGSWNQQKIKHQSSVLMSLCEGNPLIKVESPSKRDSNVASVSISWGHHNFIWGHTCIRKKTVSAIPCKQTKSAHPLTVTTATGT